MSGDDLDTLRRRAGELGVETSYWDVDGILHDAEPATLRAVVEVLEDDAGPAGRRLDPVVTGRRITASAGIKDAVVRLEGSHDVVVLVDTDTIVIPPDLPVGCHELAIAGPGLDETATLVVAPPRMPRSETLAGSAGLFVPPYALWSDDQPQPSFANLADLSGRLPARGIDVLVTLPLYAAFLDEPFDPSPYAPVSRLHWNEAYLDDRELPAIEDGPAVVGDPTELIDWRALARRRRRQLLAAARDASPPADRAATIRFLTVNPDVAAYARFRAAHPEPADEGHPREVVEASHVLAQLLADRQLASIERPGSAALALDLPIGSHPDGFETWAHAGLFAPSMAVGAPPDSFFADGQNWGLPPQLPAAGRRSGHRLWRDLVRRAGRHASLLRIDHVMGVHRLWWIPEGAPAHEGCYVRYPREEILAVIAAEAHVAGTTIVGEDLGTVPQAVFDALDRWDVLGLYEEQFHLHDAQLPPVPARTVAGVRTHDMPAFASLAGVVELANYHRLVTQSLGREVEGSPAALLDAALERLATSEAYSVVADLDDLRGETAAHNVPGLILETAWRRRLPRPIAEVLDDPVVSRRLALIARRSAR